jgi:hypothetical protein
MKKESSFNGPPRIDKFTRRISAAPIRFKATKNALIFSKSDMDLPFVTYNADLLATVAPQLEGPSNSHTKLFGNKPRAF